jgi:hypothetical protein
MKTTFDQYISNPGGKGASAIHNRLMYQETYSKQWDELKLRENGLVLYRLYKSDKDYYIHFKIPSGIDTGFYYDVVIRFFPGEDAGHVMMEKTLKNYNVQFYSNDPNFVFTFCYAYKSNGLFIKDLEPRMSKLALKQPAKIKNPRNEVGYVKTIYYAYLEMKRNDLFQKGRWENRASKYNKSVWNTTVAHADDKIKDAQELQDAKRKEDKKLKAKERNANAEFERKSSNNIKNNFKSPNIKDFGHFKAPTPEKLGVIIKTIPKGFGHFKKSN